MNKVKVYFLVLIVAIFFCAGSIYAEETESSGYASVDVMSNYVWN